MEIALLFAILGIALVLFLSERIRADLVSMLVLLALALTGLVSTSEAFSGFSNPAVITVGAMFVMSAAAARTGIASFIGRAMRALAGHREWALTLVMMLTVAALSAFINNVGAVAILLPVVMTLAHESAISPSKLLIPLAYGSMMGGLCTLIGTPPNILVSTIAVQNGLRPFELFEFAPIGLAVVGAGVLYMVLIGRWLIPARRREEITDSMPKYFLTELVIPTGSKLISQRPHELGWRERGIEIIEIRRGKRQIFDIWGWASLQANDVLIVSGKAEEIFKLKDEFGLEIRPEVEYTHPWHKSEEIKRVEATLAPHAAFIGKTLAELDFHNRYGLAVLAIARHGTLLRGQLSQIPLQFGDTLLLQGPEQRLAQIPRENFILMSPLAFQALRTEKAPVTVLIFAGVLALAGLGVLHISVAGTLGAVLMVLTRCLTLEEAYESIDWMVIFLLAGMIPAGIALERTGAAQLLAEFILKGIGSFGPLFVLGVLMAFTSLITEILSNAAAAVLLAPIAISLAAQLGVSPYPFLMGVAVAASSSFMTPIGHQSNTLVFGPGGYRFSDYLRVGVVLNILVWVVAMLVIPRLWPF
ncbi:MAG: anion permease [Candidatus Bipolaricaulota bacterium]|nr:anion permease [Candidatus Bipolaricaulota bacterium]